jgi:penicillin amidase
MALLRRYAFVFVLLLTAAWVMVLDRPIQQKGLTIAALSKFFSPFVGFWANEEARLPNYPVNIPTGRLKQPAKVVYDSLLVPHIYAQNLEDAAYVQGYVLAQQRLWQMDFIARASAGRLSEILGRGKDDAILKYDLEMRRSGMGFAAQNALQAWQESPETMPIVQAFTDGVNAYLSYLTPKDYPVEFKFLDYEPQRWDPLKSAYVLKYMARDLVWDERDIENTNARKIFGPELFDYLYPEHFRGQSPVVPDTAWDFNPSKTFVPPHLGRPEDLISYRSEHRTDEGWGSNNWVLSGQRTLSGHPILCNDPHLSLNLPSIWFLVHIVTPETNVFGVCIPGAPGVIIGFNENIAWGVTNASHDVKDWYKIQWADAERSAYKIDSIYKKPTLIIETINIRGEATVYDTVRYTEWGPVVCTDPSDPRHDLALRWLAHDKSNEALTFLKLNTAKNYQDYLDALQHYTTPAQNFAFASRTGDIALWVKGLFPLRYPQQGRFVQDGSLSENYWQGFIPNEHAPHQVNPQRGWCSSANQHSTGPDYPYYYLGRFDAHRGRYINERLADIDRATIAEMMDLQNDDYSIKARQFMPVFLQHVQEKQLDTLQRGWLRDLKRWKYRYDTEDAMPVFFKLWFDKTKSLAFDEMQRSDYPLPMPEDWAFLQMLIQAPYHDIFDIKSTPAQESALQILTNSWKETVDEVSAWQEKHPRTPITWPGQQEHAARHLLPGLKGFSVTLWAPGDKSAPNALGTTLGARPRTSGPSWRMIVDLSPEGKAWGVFPGGQSGNPGSPYYANFVDAWSSGNYYELDLWKSEAEAVKEALCTISFF